jgi:polar amino acid transport system substrate-binding protein
MRAEQVRDRTIFIVLVSALVLVACAIAIFFFFILFGMDLFQDKPTPSPALQTTQQTDLIWDRINQNKKIVVGIAPDYPPFAYVDQNFAIQGYDLALIQEVGKRLNLPLDIRNMAFDGLMNSLILGQIDIAAAAISITPERDRVIDFTNVYYVGQDAVLAQKDSTIQITKETDLANYRVGVQRASAYEEWITANLVQPGLMPPQNLITYQTVGDAVKAMLASNPEIDLVFLDAQPADLLTATQPVKVIIHGLDPQRFALAIPHNAPVLQAKLNQVLSDMQNDGTLNLLDQNYLNVTNPEPLPTREPTAQPVPPSGCLDAMKYVQDLNYPDSNMTSPAPFAPGAGIEKGWRIQNTGTCTWDSNYALTYVSANPPNTPIGGNPVAIQGQVSPGQTYDIYASVVAPPQPDRYQSIWNLRNPKGLYFGDRLWIGFDVTSPATPTTAPQPPTIFRFTVDRNQILQGQCVSLSWQYGGSNITTSRIFSNNVVILQDMASTGSSPNCPPNIGNVEYRIQIDTQSAGSAVASQFVNVLPPVQPTFTPVPIPALPPVINFFVVDNTQVQLGQCVNLSWSFSGSNLIATELFRNNTLIENGLFSSGSQSDCPGNVGTQEYRIRVTSLTSGVAESSVFVNVGNPTPTAPSVPVIQSFTVQPTSIQQGGCVNLNWSFVAPGQVNSQLLRDGQTIASNLSYQGGFQDCLNVEILNGVAHYTLEIDYAPGGTVSANRNVSVTP